MPDISGMELLAEVRRCYPHLAFVVAMAWTMWMWARGRAIP